MSNNNSEIKTFLIFQGNLPVENIKHAKQLFDEFETFLTSWSPKAKINGQVISHLGSCCGQNSGGINYAKVPFIVK